MLGLNSEIIVGIAFILLAILFLYAATTPGETGKYWSYTISYGVVYALIALGIAFIVHGIWTKRNLAREARVEPHHH
jgi:uncharacterized membrane protein